MTDSENFDANRLRRLDRPRRPGVDADAVIKARMFDSFDSFDSAEEPAESGALLQPPIEVADSNLTEVVDLNLRRLDDGAPRRDQSWGYRLAAAAAVIVIVGIGVLFANRDSDDAAPVASNTEIVTEFCETTVDDLLGIFAAYHDNQTGETQIRALRNLELLAQAYTDLANDLEAPLSADVRAAGTALLDQAAATRRAVTIVGSDGDEMTELISAIATDIERLPGSSSCSIGRLRGE